METATTEFEALVADARRLEESGLHYIFLPNLRMPDGCTPEAVDALLCLDDSGGYPSRLFFAQQITKAGVALNWNGNVHILSRNWVAFSWKDVPGDQHPVRVLLGHLDALR
jgi:hypothetical protein